MGFAEDLNRLCERAGGNAEKVVRKVAIDMASAMVQRVPVATGRYKGNFQVGLGSINKASSEPPDPTGSGSIGRIAAGMQTWKPGQTIHVTNSLAYGPRLEHGWSKQAPAGFLAVTVAEFHDHIRKALGDVK